MSLMHRALEWSAVYEAFQAAVAGARCDDYFVQAHVRPRPGQKLLDLGCGPGNLLGRLGGTDYTGIDINGDYIAQARRRDAAGAARFLEGPFDDPRLAELAPFDTVIANGLLHHLDDGEVLALLHLARGWLGAGGRLVTLDGCYAPGQGALARFVVSRDRGRHVRPVADYLALAGEVFDRVEHEVRSDLLRIPYTHIVMSCS